MLTGLNQNGTWSAAPPFATEHTDRKTTGVQAGPTPLVVMPLGWEHINLTGDYVWGAPHRVSENPDGLRSLRMLPEAYPRAA